MQSLADALIFLVSSLSSFWMYLCMVRFLMQTCRANFRQPLARWICTWTDPVLIPLRRFIPGWKGWDWSALFACFLVQFGVNAVIISLRWGPGHFWAFPWDFWLIAPVFGVIQTLLQCLFWAILGRVLFGLWMLLTASPTFFNRHPLLDILESITEPFLQAIHRYSPLPLQAGGLDFAPFVACVLINMTQIALGLGTWRAF